ncbi:putative Phytocyanin domain, cupredoxin [Helianthus annuus]|uniref:Phytocyanin domain, cupredoxin n=1 Tax=Helianthus annuus TaxID=4232 RepID=A0A251VA62_HELAN|nr:blue copper protein 1b [Helianthus annuus]KAF5816185.1 putative Phytocyanin domain, cupredoxin [Helianthus annuus]KAJ0602729.1 putative Phytocyanin domain, cupredoxin [Helianthus annuus]KAJ0769607.1 putative Phytocyanin domain, cupredoxin [Helianthus annuus]KAJ0937501.1 putative Phytocyanin domain, cupredoxin [Helianthus annuus]KAJ0945458.1 putative Phytocyanin domain, cupredoxin [Helianthus annuus]
MAAARSTIIFISTIFLLATSISAKEYVVGDGSGWTLDFDYQAWAKDKVFYVGDKLVFNYASGTHNVVKVNGTGFQQCSTSSNNGTLTSGRDVIPLQTPGKKWYICGVAKHCESRNMKLVITVLSQSMSSAVAISPVSITYGIVAALFSGLMLTFLV